MWLSLALDRFKRFRRYDEEVLKKQALVYDDAGRLIQGRRDATSDLQQLFEADAECERQRDADKPRSGED